MRSTAQLRNVYDPAFMRKVKRTLNAYKESMGESKTKGLSREAFVDVDSKGAAWYLGHMRSTATELQEKVKDADFILEIRDARLPFTTANPNIKQLTRKKPSLLIFNKAELANEDCNRAAQDYFERHGQFTIFTSARRSWRDIVEAVQRFCTHILPQPAFRCTAHVGLVVGMPNVGKSTLINALRLAHEHQFHREDFRRSRTPEQVSITPGTTRGLKLVPLSKDPNIVLYDSPGLTLPGCFAKEAGLKLAACGIIPTNNLTLPNSTVARYIYDIMVASSSTEHLAECLRLPRAPISFDDCMAMMCERSGSAGLTELGNVDPRRAHRFLLHDFQMGNLGKLTLDPLPRHMLKATHDHPQLEPNLSDRGSSSTSSTGEEEVVGEEDFTWTHHVETADVVDRAPEHMRGVLEALKGSPAHTAAATHRTRRPPTNTGVREDSEGVISRKRGPISRVAPQSALRFAPGR